MTQNKNIKKHLKIITECLLEKKASDIKIIYVDKLTSLTDIFIICTSNSNPQTKAIVNHIISALEDENIKALHTEGYRFLNWVLIDYVNIIVNIFNKKTREYYNIERLWADAKIELIKESFESNEK